MKLYSIPRRKILLGISLSIILVVPLEGLRWIDGGDFIWRNLVLRWLFVVSLLGIAQIGSPHSIKKWHCVWPWSAVLVIGASIGLLLVYIVSKATWSAWGVLGSLYLTLIWLDTTLSTGQGTFWNWLVHILLALAGGLTPIIIAQVESQFAGEEFFVAVQALALSLFWLLLLGAHSLLTRSRKRSPQGFHLDSRWIAPVLVLLSIVGGGGTVRSYQNSFYPSEVPIYEGISPQTPFICGEAQPNPQRFDGEEVFRRLLARVEANPHKDTPEYGMLALGTGKQHWAQAFRKSLLNEAAEGLYTGPANSVKSVQYEASLRAYYLPRVDVAFPGLFSEDDLIKLEEWFTSINYRALTVEWVDWMYALAFAKKPEGPYENQEIGAGLLALLETESIGAPDLSQENQNYLEQTNRGWDTYFRNTDDAFVYQPVWINNAYFQSLYTEKVSQINKRLSFEWLLLQTLPDGTPPGYNHPADISLAGTAYLGARLLEDPRYIWLAGQALTQKNRFGAKEPHPPAQPGVEAALSLEGHSPTQGSCLIYGNSGLPNQMGPLAPDKIVLRESWSEESPYLLLNLRFTGWHRYKGTNTISSVYKNGPLVTDVFNDHAFNWLPKGRMLFRDKRIPRGNLNGLLVERTGMSSVLYSLTQMGELWAQDPPQYANVVAFETGKDLDWTHTRLAKWRGWQHDRWIYFYHNNGPIIVVDKAEGPFGRQAALAWHFENAIITNNDRVQLHSSKDTSEAILVPLDSEEGETKTLRESGDPNVHMVYYATNTGRLYLATLFLFDKWVNAEISISLDKKELILSRGQATTRHSLDLEK